MEYSHVSNYLWIRLEENELICFTQNEKESKLPSKEQVQKRVTGIEIAYACCGEQDFGIEPLLTAFHAKKDGQIQEIPETLSLKKQEKIWILKYGNTFFDPRMLSLTKEVGMTGYWDKENIVICASEPYEEIIKNIVVFLERKRAKFTFKGPNLMIIE